MTGREKRRVSAAHFREGPQIARGRGFSEKSCSIIPRQSSSFPVHLLLTGSKDDAIKGSMILELGISELNALILLLDDQGAGAISAEDGLGQDVGGRISQAVLLAAGQLDDLVSLEVAGQRGVANLLDPAGILHEVAGVNGMSVTNLGLAQEQGFITKQTDSQLSADIAPSGHNVSALDQLTSIMSIASRHTGSQNDFLANHSKYPPKNFSGEFEVPGEFRSPLHPVLRLFHTADGKSTC